MADRAPAGKIANAQRVESNSGTALHARTMAGMGISTKIAHTQAENMQRQAHRQFARSNYHTAIEFAKEGIAFAPTDTELTTLRDRIQRTMEVLGTSGDDGGLDPSSRISCTHITLRLWNIDGNFSVVSDNRSGDLALVSAFRLLLT